MGNKSFIVVLMFVVLTTGCTIKGPSVKLEAPGVEIGMQGGGTHCPPGQAKKGRC
jgi:hypothetical protein